ncbi:Acyl-protein thioesterase 1 [Orchesella cincta]|uniref:palmitoyl-protein hydrolase n=1 Tax=Orchesella cincta TaxID=48709 RepID=A0A1D2NFI5_ORCCI|nr:Acyl-protein thioesterase 1 [Orchesella cincta]
MMSLPLRAPCVVPAAVKQTATIIFLHGVGDSGQGWAEILPDLRPPHAKIICPSAAHTVQIKTVAMYSWQSRPIQTVTINDGMAMPSWFDLRRSDQPKDETGIKMAADAIKEIIDSEMKAGIPSRRIVLGGFSQGGALALYTGLTLPYTLAGILALSTWLPMYKSIPWNTVRNPKVLQCQGDADVMVSMKGAQRTADLLKKHLQENHTFKLYPGLGHTISNEDELRDIMQFFHVNLPTAESKL